MDCVILYKAPTAHEGEVLYTIRSVTKNLKFDNLIVIGDKPIIPKRQSYTHRLNAER